MLLTPEEFESTVIPAVLAAWESRCFCRVAGFRKLLSFNFEDYGVGPMSLFDSESIGCHIIDARFRPLDDWHQEKVGENLRNYQCPQCGTHCRSHFEEFSISMARTYYHFPSEPTPRQPGLYLLGIRAFNQSDFESIHDFRPADSVAEFLAHLGAD